MFSKKYLGAGCAVNGVCPFGYLKENEMKYKDQVDFLTGFAMGILHRPIDPIIKRAFYSTFIEGLKETENGHKLADLIEKWAESKRIKPEYQSKK